MENLNENIPNNTNEKNKTDKLEIILEENNCNISEENNNPEKDKEKKSATSSKNSNSNQKNNFKYSPQFLFNEQNSENKINNDDNINNNYNTNQELSKKNLKNIFEDNEENNYINNNTEKKESQNLSNENDENKFKNNSIELIGYNLIQNQIKIFNDDKNKINKKENENNNDFEQDKNNENINIDNEYNNKNENENNIMNYISDENKFVSDNNDSGFNIITNLSETENFNNTPKKKEKIVVEELKDNNIKQDNDNDNINNQENENQINVLYSYEGYVNNNNDNENDIQDKKEENNHLNEEYFKNSNEIVENIKDNTNNKNSERKEDLNNKNNNEDNPEIKEEKNKEKSGEKEDNKLTENIQLDNIEINKSINKNEDNVDKVEGEVLSPEKENKLNMSNHSKNKEKKDNQEKEKQSSSKKGALKILELLMSKKKEKEEIDKKKEEIMLETFQRARSKPLLDSDTFKEKNINNNSIQSEKIERNEIDYSNKKEEENANKNENKEYKENIIESNSIEENNVNINNSDNKNAENKNNNINNNQINEENKEMKKEELNNSLVQKEEKVNNVENIPSIITDNKREIEKADSNQKPPNNLKINLINPNKVYKKNSRKMFSRINNDKSKNNNLFNTNSFSTNKNKNNDKEIITTVNYKNSNDNIKSQRNKESLELKKASNTIDNIPKIKKKKPKKLNENFHKKSHTPVNNYNQYNQEISEKDINSKKNKNNEEDIALRLYNNNYGSLENSFDGAKLYKKRRLNQKEFSQSPRENIYAPKKALNQRGNSLGKINPNPNALINKSNININNVNYINNINTIIKNKSDESLISVAYAKKSPIPNRKDNILRLNNSININNINNYMDNDYNNFNNIKRQTQNYPKNYNNNNYNVINNYNYNNAMNNNNNIKPRKKYLMSSKTTSLLKKRKNIPNYGELDLSSDKINYNQNNNLRRIKNNYMNDNQFIDNNNLYNIKNNNYNKISSFPQRMKAKNQLIPSIYPNKANNSLSQRYFNYNFNNSYEIENNYYTNNNKNMLNNNLIGKYNNPQNYNIDEYNNNENDIGNYYIPNNNYNINKKQNSSISINIEDLMVLEEKLSEIIFFLKNREEVKNQCFDFWNYYYNCSLYQRIEKTFKIENKIEIVKLSINLELLSVMLCYEFSFDHKILNKTYILLLEVLELNYRNLMIICENILTKITAENQKNRWVLKLRKIVQNSKMTETGNYQNISYADKIGINTDKINKKLLNILLNYQTEYSPLIMSLMKKITQKNYEEINDFFREYILKVENLESSIVASILLNTNPNFVSHRPPYLHSPRAKSYTLILDLNETLVSFQQTNYSQGILRLRPFLIEFLEEISYYYELILFTASTEYFAKPIINAIEENKKYFDYVFYRECCIIIGNDFVKDLTRIGRPLDSTIIVDNMPQNFKLQKENGINIKSFYAQDPNDSALYNLLPILIDIAEDEVDVREGLAKYRNEIVKSVTSNISKYNI